MKINSLIAVLILLGFVFYPSIEDWALQSDSFWYRPFLLWLLIIAISAWHNHLRVTDNFANANRDDSNP